MFWLSPRLRARFASLSSPDALYTSPKRKRGIRVLQFFPRLRLGLVLGLLSSPSAWAQVPEQPIEQRTDQPVEIPETVVTARQGNFPAEPLPADVVVSPNRTPTPASESGSSITVITQEQIERSGQTSVAEVLRNQLGVDVVRQGGPGGQTSLFLRGGNSGHTKVLLDGISLNDPSNASRLYDFSTLTTDNIERIEVLRGPQSMVYGSDAIGGVVNIITARGQGPLAIRARGMGGSFNTGQTSVNASGGDDVRYYSVTGSFLSTGGISAASARNGNTEHDSFNIGTASGRVGWNVTPQWNIDYVFRYVDAAAEIDDFDFGTGLPIDSLTAKNITKNFANRLQFSQSALDGVVQQRIGLSLNDYDRTAIDPGPFSPPLFHGQSREVDYFASAMLTETNTVSAGANYLAEDAFSTGMFGSPEASQNVKGVFLQDQFQFGRNWFGTAGVRFDDTSRAGSAQTYRVTSLYKIPTTATAFHGSIGTGFRQPALAENLFLFGNPNLRPEKSKGWDVGMRQSIWEDVIVADATYFRNDFQDLIVFDFNTFTLQNVGAARSSGVELTLLCYLTEELWVNVAYTFDDTLNLDTGDALIRRPRDKVNLSLTRTWDTRASATLAMLYVGDRLDTNNAVLDQYALLNLSGNFHATEQLELFARLDNITDTFYEEVRGFGTPGFSAYGGVNYVW